MTAIKRLALIWRVAKVVPHLESLDAELSGADEQKQAEIALKAGVIDKHQFGRLRMLWKFSKLAPKAQEIELEWQKIQQDEHDAFFKFQIFKGNADSEYAYKKGIAEGIKWCLSRFC